MLQVGAKGTEEQEGGIMHWKGCCLGICLEGLRITEHLLTRSQRRYSLNQIARLFAYKIVRFHIRIQMNVTEYSQ
jgi:hypothetical protein